MSLFKSPFCLFHIQTSPHLPFEYSALGTLQRVALLLENQDFCDYAFDFDDVPSKDETVIQTLRFNSLPRLPWPPKSAFVVGFAKPGQNCKGLYALTLLIVIIFTL